ncbi:MAG: porin [Desulfobacteraceae bacterium]|nr:porin [Desulfobacteraceae bacterium]
MEQRCFKVCQILFLMGWMLIATTTPAKAEDKTTLQRLEKIIQQQQIQIKAQAKAIEALQKQVNIIQGGSEKMVEHDKDRGPTSTVKPLEVVNNNLLNSGNKNVGVTLYGQVNRGVLVADDGHDTEVYQVDNKNSSTRIGLLGVAKASEQLEVGSLIEVQFEANSTYDVNQFDKHNVGNNNFTKRDLDVYVKYNPLGTLSLGYGSTASDTTSEIDLSGTTVAGYSGVAFMAGGLYFYDNATQAYSTTKIKNVFTNMDGLEHNNRVRYDTPSFYGFSIATSIIDGNGGGDLSLRYEEEFNRFKLSAAASYSNPGSTSTKKDYQFNSSASALHDSGISLTLAGGHRVYEDDADGKGLFFYTKLGYQTDFFSFGKTAFSIDYGRCDDMSMKNDQAIAWGGQFVQNLRDWGTEYYIGFRNYKLDRDNTDYDNINALLSGFRVKF